MGPVDDPHEPPCVRCRRESKECYFSATRRKRKGDGGDDAADLEQYATRNHRRKTSNIQDSPENVQSKIWQSNVTTESTTSSPASPSVGYSWGTHDKTRLPRVFVDEHVQEQPGTPGEQEVTNETAAALFQSPINNPGDALHLLLEASGRTGDLHRQAPFRDDGRLDSSRPVVPNLSGRGGRNLRSSPARPSNSDIHLTNIDPSIANADPMANESGSVLQLYRKALRTWSRLRFVRAGWFTAVEAMSYID